MRNNGTDIRSIASRSRCLLMKAQLAGNLMLDGHDASEEENMIASMCNDMCDLIRRKLPVCRDTEIPQLIECYDMLYRVANHKLPDAAMITGYTRRLLTAWKSGNKEIEESMVYGLISSSARLYPERTDNATKKRRQDHTPRMDLDSQKIRVLPRCLVIRKLPTSRPPDARKS